MDEQAFVGILAIVAIALIVISFVAGLGLFFALLFKRKANKNVPLVPADARQELSGSEADYFSYIKYDSEKNAIVLKQSQVFKKCVVTLITKKNGALSIKRYNLQYADGDLYCGIKLDGAIDEYKVVLESIDNSVKKHAPVDTFLSMNIIYAIVVTLLFMVGCFVYVYMWAFSLLDEWPGYAFYYIFVFFALLFIAIIVGGCLLFDNLSKKGKF